MGTTKIFYYIGETISLKTKARSAKLGLMENSFFIQDQEGSHFEIAFSELKSVSKFRMHGLGTVLKINTFDKTIYFSAVWLNLSGYFVIINFFKTNLIFHSLQNKTKSLKLM